MSVLKNTWLVNNLKVAKMVTLNNPICEEFITSMVNITTYSYGPDMNAQDLSSNNVIK